MTDAISFDKWVRRVFDRPVGDPAWWSKAETEWNELPSLVSLDYLTRLFEDSAQIFGDYSDAQVDEGLWFLIGCGSDHAFAIMDRDVPWPIRLRCVRSILALFKFFSTRCSLCLSHLDEPGATPINSICYMFWDIISLIGLPEDSAFKELDLAVLDVLTELLQFASDACRESALHGLGHWQDSYPREVDQIVSAFLAKAEKIRPELRAYAENSRQGMVQ